MRVKCTNPATKALKAPWMDRTIRFGESRTSRYEVSEADGEQLIETYPSIEAVEEDSDSDEDSVDEEADAIIEETEAADDE